MGRRGMEDPVTVRKDEMVLYSILGPLLTPAEEAEKRRFCLFGAGVDTSGGPMVSLSMICSSRSFSSRVVGCVESREVHLFRQSEPTRENRSGICLVE